MRKFEGEKEDGRKKRRRAVFLFLPNLLLEGLAVRWGTRLSPLPPFLERREPLQDYSSIPTESCTVIDAWSSRRGYLSRVALLLLSISSVHSLPPFSSYPFYPSFSTMSSWALYISRIIKPPRWTPWAAIARLMFWYSNDVEHLPVIRVCLRCVIEFYSRQSVPLHSWIIEICNKLHYMCILSRR